MPDHHEHRIRVILVRPAHVSSTFSLIFLSCNQNVARAVNIYLYLVAYIRTITRFYSFLGEDTVSTLETWVLTIRIGLCQLILLYSYMSVNVFTKSGNTHILLTTIEQCKLKIFGVEGDRPKLSPSELL